MGARRHYLPAAKYAIEFQSTRPHGGATHVEHIDDTTPGISIHAPAWGRDDTAPPALLASPISIHAPAWGRDARSNSRYATVQISIHAPAWGRDTASSTARCSRWRFQSTRPHGGATMGIGAGLGPVQFQSTRPHGGATASPSTSLADAAISIHAPAWGRDDDGAPSSARGHNFNPRARMGARLRMISFATLFMRFQSTRPHGGATAAARFQPSTAQISIHAPAWGRDATNMSFCAISRDFNPRARMGARPQIVRKQRIETRFQSTRPHGGATVPVYTGLITAVTLYFSRTSFSAVLLQAFFVAKSSV